MLLTTIRHTVPQAHVLWSASEVVHNPGHKGRIHQHRRQLVTQQSRPDGIESTGEVKECDPHSAPRLVQVSVDMVQQVNDGILNSNPGLVGELEGIQVQPYHKPELIQDESLQGLHDMRCQCHRSISSGPYHRDALKAQAHVEDTVKHSTDLFGAGSENLVI